jgi:hypothetical protein
MASDLWDGDKNQFFGAPAQSVDGRPLYKVDTEWSKDFSALNPKADQMVLSGGIRDYDHWYAWGYGCAAGDMKPSFEFRFLKSALVNRRLEQKLTAGRRTFSFSQTVGRWKPSEAATSGYGKDEQIQNADLPFQLGEQQHAPAIVNVLDAQKSVRLVERPLEGSEKTLTLEVLLNYRIRAGKVLIALIETAIHANGEWPCATRMNRPGFRIR